MVAASHESLYREEESQRFTANAGALLVQGGNDVAAIHMYGKEQSHWDVLFCSPGPRHGMAFEGFYVALGQGRCFCLVDGLVDPEMSMSCVLQLEGDDVNPPPASAV